MTVYRVDVQLALTEGGTLDAVTYLEAPSKTVARERVEPTLRGDVIMPPFDSFTIASVRVENLVVDQPEED